MNTLEQYAETLGNQLLARNWQLTTAESCTGGWIAQTVTSISGSSNWFDRSFVTYSNQAKQEMLKVQADTLANHGAVSEAVVQEMVQGALAHSVAQVAIAVSGIAGPTGGTLSKPIGTVWIGWGLPTQHWAMHYRFDGDRQAVRQQAVQSALQVLVAELEGA